MIFKYLKKFWAWLYPETIIESPTIVSAPAPVVKPIPKRPRRIKKCDTMHKLMFTREEAEQAKKEILKKGKAQYLRIYPCQFCNWWHLTHKKTNI